MADTIDLSAKILIVACIEIFQIFLLDVAVLVFLLKKDTIGMPAINLTKHSIS